MEGFAETVTYVTRGQQPSNIAYKIYRSQDFQRFRDLSWGFYIRVGALISDDRSPISYL